VSILVASLLCSVPECVCIHTWVTQTQGTGRYRPHRASWPLSSAAWGLWAAALAEGMKAEGTGMQAGLSGCGGQGMKRKRSC
jgi:hypothetical protein